MCTAISASSFDFSSVFFIVDIISVKPSAIEFVLLSLESFRFIFWCLSLFCCIVGYFEAVTWLEPLLFAGFDLISDGIMKLQMAVVDGCIYVVSAAGWSLFQSECLLIKHLQIVGFVLTLCFIFSVFAFLSCFMCCWSLEESFHFLASVAVLCYKEHCIAFVVDAESCLHSLLITETESACGCCIIGVVSCFVVMMGWFCSACLSDWHAGVRVCTTVALSASLDEAKLDSISVSARWSTSKSNQFLPTVFISCFKLTQLLPGLCCDGWWGIWWSEASLGDCGIEGL